MTSYPALHAGKNTFMLVVIFLRLLGSLVVEFTTFFSPQPQIHQSKDIQAARIQMTQGLLLVRFLNHLLVSKRTFQLTTCCKMSKTTVRKWIMVPQTWNFTLEATFLYQMLHQTKYYERIFILGLFWSLKFAFFFPVSSSVIIKMSLEMRLIQSGFSWGKTGVGSGENHILVIVVIISVGAFTTIVVVVGAFLCTRRTNNHQKK